MLRYLPVAVLLLASCSAGNGRLPVFATTGKVLFLDRPLAGAVLIFHPDDPTILVHPTAHTTPDGTFHVTTYTNADGCPAGNYRVTVTWSPTNDAPEASAGAEIQLSSPPRYSRPETSGLTAVVEKCPTTLPPFSLSR
jgi:hypothetical protein